MSIEHESNSDRNKTLSEEEDLNKIRPYLKDIINNLKNKSQQIPTTNPITLNFEEIKKRPAKNNKN